MPHGFAYRNGMQYRLFGKPIWTEEEDEAMRRDYLQIGPQRMAERLGRTLRSVYHRGKFLKLRFHKPKDKNSPGARRQRERRARLKGLR